MQTSQKAESNPSPARRAMLLALNYTGKNIYQGTVPAAVKARRRAANKAARRARRSGRAA